MNEDYNKNNNSKYFKTIKDISKIIEVQEHTIRFWISKFNSIYFIFVFFSFAAEYFFTLRNIMNVSSKNNYGINSLLNTVFQRLSEKNFAENTYISRERHVECLKKTKKYLEKSKQKKNYDVFSEDIRLAIKEISKIYGKVDIENILDIIFSDFCIGK